MEVDLFIKKMPYVVKKLITRQAFDNRRSVNQETIALLEEALIHRVAATGKTRRQVEALLAGYAESRDAEAVDSELPADVVPPVKDVLAQSGAAG